MTRADIFKTTPAYVLHPANAPHNTHRPTFRDEFRERHEDRLEHALRVAIMDGLGEISGLLDTSELE